MRKSNITAKEQLGLRELIAMGVGGITGHATPVAFALGGLLAQKSPVQDRAFGFLVAGA